MLGRRGVRMMPGVQVALMTSTHTKLPDIVISIGEL